MKLRRRLAIKLIFFKGPSTIINPASLLKDFSKGETVPSHSHFLNQFAYVFPKLSIPGFWKRCGLSLVVRQVHIVDVPFLRLKQP